MLYLGGFELPDKNAAAQRVLSIAKALREYKCEVHFCGITHENDCQGSVFGFDYEAINYPESKKAWIKYALGEGVINKIKDYSPDFVFCYNYPAIAQLKIINYCKAHHIKTIGDITEWYDSRDLPKKVDIELRMRLANKKLDGIIAISRYLSDYYSQCKSIYIPPLVDLEEKKWSKNKIAPKDDLIRLVYVGSPGKKDRIDYVVKAFHSVKSKRLLLDIMGITAEQYLEVYEDSDVDDDRIHFLGRLPHVEAIEKLKASDFQLFFRDNTRVNNAGFPTKYVESVSAGVAVITNRISNVCDYLKDGINGFVVDDISDESLVDVLNKVAALSREEIDVLKKNSGEISFDYKCFSSQLWSFLHSI